MLKSWRAVELFDLSFASYVQTQIKTIRWRMAETSCYR